MSEHEQLMAALQEQTKLLNDILAALSRPAREVKAEEPMRIKLVDSKLPKIDDLLDDDGYRPNLNNAAVG